MTSQPDPSPPDEAWNPEESQMLIESMVGDLRGYAHRMMSRRGMNLTIQPTELVSMAFMRLHGRAGQTEGLSQAELFGLYVTTMKNLLKDHLRRRGRLKHGGGRKRVPLDDWIEPLEQAQVDPAQFLDLLEELQVLGQQEERQYQIVMARVFYQLTNAEIAAQLNISVSTVEDDLRRGREWLRSRVEP